MSLSGQPHSNGSPCINVRGVRNSRFVRDGLTFFSAALLIVSLPSPDIGWLGWVALVPLMMALQGLQPLQGAGLGLVTGIIASFGIYGWLFEVPSFDLRHAVLLALYVGAYTGPSQLIDGQGRIQAEIRHLFSVGAVTGHLQTGTGGTFYSAIGDAALFIFLLPLASWVLWWWRAQASIHIVGHPDAASKGTGLEGLAQRQLR